jgi:hypothetical protein
MAMRSLIDVARTSTAPRSDRVASLEQRVRVLELALAALLEQQRRTLSRREWALLERLYPAIGGAFGSERFASRDLAASPTLRLVLGGRSVKTIGRLLARAVGIAIDGFVVERCGRELRVTLWRVVAVVSDNEKPPRITGGAPSSPAEGIA